MYAVRQIQNVENGRVIVQLPADFPAERVEVIVLPAPGLHGDTLSQLDKGAMAIQRFVTMDTSHLTAEQMKAYQRASDILRKGRKPDEPLIFGLFEGLGWVDDDFDVPLSDEVIDLFYGSETDEYGISMPQ